MTEDDDSIKTLVLKHLQPSTLTFGDELNLSVILGENIDDDGKEDVFENAENISFPTRDIAKSEKKLNDQYVCSVCQKTFPSKRYLNRHFSKHTSQFKCPSCEKVLCRKETLLKHVPRCKKNNQSRICTPKKKVRVRRENVKKYSCEKCSKGFTRRENYDQHVMTHYGMKVVCYVCEKVLQSFKSYRRHIKDHQIEKSPLTCALCPAKFSLKSNLRRHELHQHSNELMCDKCNRPVKNENALQRHRSKETVNCTICSALFCLETELKSHLKRDHQDLWFFCKLCFATTPFMTRCKHHLKDHVKKTHSINFEADDCYKDGWYMLLKD